jgi:hypothetical protein
MRIRKTGKRLKRGSLLALRVLLAFSFPSLVWAQPTGAGSMRFSYQAPLSRLQPRHIEQGVEPDSLETPADAPPDVILSPAFLKLPGLETRLLGHSYPSQEVPQRLARLERLLFGAPQTSESDEARMARIAMRVRQNSERRALVTHDSLVAYLENRLFQRTFENKPLPDRLKQLEMQVFGLSFDSYPNAIRLKKLTYAVPLNSGEVRLSHAGENDLIASTHNKKRPRQMPPESSQELLSAESATSSAFPKPKPSSIVTSEMKTFRRGNSIKEKTTSLPGVSQATHPTEALEPTELPPSATRQLSQLNNRQRPVLSLVSSEQPIRRGAAAPIPIASAGGEKSTTTAAASSETAAAISSKASTTPSYFSALLRQPNGSMLRWPTLSVRVFSKGGVGREAELAAALKAWQPLAHWLVVPDAAHSDVIVSWEEADWLQNTHGFLLRPIVQVNEQQSIRTVLMLTFFPLQGQSAIQRQHTMTHVLGHALGLWGHSSQPSDLMYPAYTQESTDFPTGWAGAGSQAQSAASLPVPAPETVAPHLLQPSEADFETLQAVYRSPLTELGH